MIRKGGMYHQVVIWVGKCTMHEVWISVGVDCFGIPVTTASFFSTNWILFSSRRNLRDKFRSPKGVVHNSARPILSEWRLSGQNQNNSPFDSLRTFKHDQDLCWDKSCSVCSIIGNVSSTLMKNHIHFISCLCLLNSSKQRKFQPFVFSVKSEFQSRDPKSR